MREETQITDSLKAIELSTLVAELTSGDDVRAEAAANRLPEFGEAGLVVLRSLLTDPSPDVRWWAVRALVEYSGCQTNPLIISALGDTDQAVRQCAILALHQCPDESAVGALISMMFEDDSLTARLAANALIAIGAPAVSALISLLNDSPPRQRLEAVRALAMIGDQRSIPVLFNALDEDSALMEYWANEGLERMGVGMMFFKP